LLNGIKSTLTHQISQETLIVQAQSTEIELQSTFTHHTTEVVAIGRE